MAAAAATTGTVWDCSVGGAGELGVDDMLYLSHWLVPPGGAGVPVCRGGLCTTFSGRARAGRAGGADGQAERGWDASLQWLH